MSSRTSERQFTRRTAMVTATAGATLAMTRSLPASGEDQDRDGLIDAHVHVWTPDLDRYPLDRRFKRDDMQPPSFTPDELMAHARPSGVDRIVLIQMSYYGFDNSYMLDVIQRNPDRFRGVAVIDETDRPQQTMKQMAAKGVRGFRIRPDNRPPDRWLAGEGMQAMWAYGADAGLAMCHLINPEFLPSVDRMCRKYPRTPVVIDHFARVGIDGSIGDSDLDQLCRLADHKNVSVKISAYYALGRKAPPYADLGPMIRRVLGAFGRERLMWASDCPFQVQGIHTYAASIDLIKTGLGFLDDDNRAWLLRKTAEQVFFG